MPSDVSAPNAVFVESGRAGARKRWDRDAEAHGRPPGVRRLRLDDLTPEQRRLVLALVDAARASNAADNGGQAA